MVFVQGGAQEKSTIHASQRLTASEWLRAAVVPVWLGGLYVAANSTRFYLTRNWVGMDAHAYWLTGSHQDLYGAAPQSVDAFLYSPAFAQLIWPLTHFPWPVFVALWIVLVSATFVWLLVPLGWRWGVPAFCLCVPEIAVGNVYAFLAAAAVLGMRWPAVWAFPILTKVTPGLGPLWFAVRREWPQVAWAVGGTLALIVVSLSIAPGTWSAWAVFLLSSSGSSGPWLPMRLVAAVTLTIVGARLDKAWLLAVAMLLACPVVAGVSALSILAAIPRLRSTQVARHRPTSALPFTSPRSRGPALR
jgi:Glycosyltransferase family 87